MDPNFLKLPAKFKKNRIFLCPVTKSGFQIEFYADTGGGAIFIKPDVVKKLKLPISKKEIENGEEGQFVPFPDFQKDKSIPSGSQNSKLMVYPKIPWGQGLLGQSWFADKVWLLDYLNDEMGYAIKGSSYETNGFQSTSINFKHDDNGVRQASFPRVQAKIDGEMLDFLFDTGATVHLTEAALDGLGKGDEVLRGTSFITQSIFEKWRTRHPEWVVIEDANRLGNGAMIQVPNIELAGLETGPVWFTTRPDYNFHEFMSQWMDKRIEGALGGSLFKYYTIIIDYPNSIAYFKR